MTAGTDRVILWTQTGVVAALAVIAVVSLGYAVAELVRLAVDPTLGALESLFSAVLLVFIVLELYQIAREFQTGREVVDKVFEVGVVVLVRQIIVAEVLHSSYQEYLAIAALIVALGVAWFLARHARSPAGRLPADD